jgi:membrane protein YdbS with pleckstrin-like domain
MDGMGLPAKLLGADEYVVVQLRTHSKVLLRPALGCVAAGALTGVGTALVPTAYRPEGQLAAAAVALSLGLWWAVLPYLRWLATTYTVTNHRVLARRGLLTRIGAELPLARVSDVSYDASLLDRFLRCGTLHIRTGGDGGLVVLPDVPDVEWVHRTVTELVMATGGPTAIPALPGPRRGFDRAGRR